MSIFNSNQRIVLFLFSIFVLLMLPAFLFSQITINQSELMSLFTPPTNIKAIPGDSGSINIGYTHGPNVYDFTFLDMNNTMTFYNYEISQIPVLASRYPNTATTFAVNPQTIDGNPIFITEADSTFFAGQAFIENDYQFTHYVPIEKFTEFPIVYGNSVWQVFDVYDTTYNSSWQIIDTYFYPEFVNVSIDGFGTLQLPDTSVECLRMRREYSWFQYKEFLYLTKEGILISVSDVDESEPDTGFVGGDYIVLMPDNPNSIADDKNYTPSKFRLEQNYPNPFNPVTKIDYTLPRPERVTLTIFDCLGQEIQTLVNEFQSAGNHSISFDGSNFSSGVYFYRINAGNELSITMKMLLLK